jgi:Leucine-rich repeat (LRR) protein
LCSLTTLRRLCICRCGLTGRIPAEIGQLLALEELQLFGNQLSGAIPSSISLLTNLKLLSFGEYTGGNSFTPAPLPSCLSTLVNLEALFMANCHLKGGLPDWIGNLKGESLL